MEPEPASDFYMRILFAAVLFGALLGVYRLIGAMADGFVADEFLTPERYSDMTLLYAILPAYFLAASAVVRRRSLRVYGTLVALVPDAGRFQISDHVRPAWILAGGLVGLIYGSVDAAMGILDGEMPLLEWTLAVGNAFLWTSTGLNFGWRVGYARLFTEVGDHVRLDLFDLAQVKPVGTVASLDVLVIMGALALMPLQSLSSEFQWVFYQAGFMLGIPAAAALLILPQLGVRRNIKRSKAAKLAELDEVIAGVNQHDFSQMESLLAHRDRIASLPAWPMDTRIFSRAMFYVVVPPLAWVGAAIVEKGVDQFLN